MHAQRDIVVANLSVRHNRHDLNELVPFSGMGMILVFWALPPLQNSNGNPSTWALNTRGWENLAVFDWNRRLCRKRYEIDPWLVWVTNRKWYVADRFVSVPMTLSHLERLDARGQIFLVDSRELHSCGLIYDQIGVVTQ